MPMRPYNGSEAKCPHGCCATVSPSKFRRKPRSAALKLARKNLRTAERMRAKAAIRKEIATI